MTVLQLVLECLQRDEQAVVVSARTGQTDEYCFRLAAAIGEPKLARIDSTVLPSEHAAEADRFKRGEARLLGRRVPRTFKPVDMEEILAMSYSKLRNWKSEAQCETQWPAMCEALRATQRVPAWVRRKGDAGNRTQ